MVVINKNNNNFIVLVNNKHQAINNNNVVAKLDQKPKTLQKIKMFFLVAGGSSAL